MGETPRSRNLARAALLRERIIGALKATPSSMATRELCEMSGIVELYDKRLLPAKIDVAMRALRKQGIATRVEYGKYAIAPKADELPKPDALVQTLHLEVSKAERLISFIFSGLRVSIKVLP